MGAALVEGMGFSCWISMTDGTFRGGGTGLGGVSGRFGLGASFTQLSMRDGSKSGMGTYRSLGLFDPFPCPGPPEISRQTSGFCEKTIGSIFAKLLCHFRVTFKSLSSISPGSYKNHFKRDKLKTLTQIVPAKRQFVASVPENEGGDEGRMSCPELGHVGDVH